MNYVLSDPQLYALKGVCSVMPVGIYLHVFEENAVGIAPGNHQSTPTCQYAAFDDVAAEKGKQEQELAEKRAKKNLKESK